MQRLESLTMFNHISINKAVLSRAAHLYCGSHLTGGARGQPIRDHLLRYAWLQGCGMVLQAGDAIQACMPLAPVDIQSPTPLRSSIMEISPSIWSAARPPTARLRLPQRTADRQQICLIIKHQNSGRKEQSWGIQLVIKW